VKRHAENLPLIACRIKDAREQLGISQTELGIRAGIDEFCASARINQYERGKHTPDFLTVCNLARVLDVPSAYFYAEDENLAEMITLFGRLRAAERKSLLSSVRSLVKAI